MAVSKSNLVSLLFGLCIVSGVLSLQWGPSSPNSGVTLWVCIGHDVNIAWDYVIGPNERVIDVEYLVMGVGQQEIVVANYIRGNFLADPVTGQRLSLLPPTGLLLAGMTSHDTGVYVIRVIVHVLDSVVSYTSNVTLQVAEPPVVSHGRLQASLMDDVRHDGYSGQWYAAIACGNFSTTGQPPVHVVIMTPDNQTVSGDYDNSGQYVALLPNPVVTGQYTCHLDTPLTNCLSPHSPLLTPAVVNVDSIRQAALQQAIAQLSSNFNAIDEAHHPWDCSDVKQYDAASGVHTLFVNDLTFTAYCDQTTDGGGWTVFVNRVDGSVDFNRTWQPYEDGFGDKDGEYWLGLRNLHALTSGSRQYELRVDIGDWDNSTAYAVYDVFRVDGPEINYRLHVTDYHGTAGDSLFFQPGNGQKGVANNMEFSTPDRDNDRYYGHCAAYSHLGWWMNACYRAGPTGVYNQEQGMKWVDWKHDSHPYKTMSLMIRPHASI